MKVKVNEQGYITDYALIGDLVDSVEVANPGNPLHFEDNFTSYRVRDGTVSFDEERLKAIAEETALEDYRKRRETECFSVVNRGTLWYEELTQKQKAELKKWYRAWLDGTATLTVPEKPAWLK